MKKIELKDVWVPEKFSVEEILKIEREYLAPCVTHYYKKPVLLVKGRGATLMDAEGKEYLDCYGGISTVLAGHCNTTITRAVKKQLDLLGHTSTLYPTVPMAAYAQKLASIAPAKLKRCFFVNSGSEANEAALHLIKMYTRTHFVFSLNRSFHGRTLMAMSMTNQSAWRQNVPYATGVFSVPSPYCYRCSFGNEYPECDYECARYLEELIRCQTPNRIAGMIVEPIQGNGGVIVPPPDYFKIIYEIVKKYEGIFLSDEVQTGFGRTGEHMWGIEHWGIDPDVITMAKGIASGFPLGAFITTDRIAEILKPKDLFSTFGGNPLACVAGLANLEVLLTENFPTRAKEVGEYFRHRLTELKEKHALIGDVRGKGLMLGVELVKERRKKTPAPSETSELLERAKDLGLLLGVGGLDENVIRIKPPLVISKEQVDKAIEIIDTSLRKTK